MKGAGEGGGDGSRMGAGSTGKKYLFLCISGGATIQKVLVRLLGFNGLGYSLF